jgi:hypothetical protein
VNEEADGAIGEEFGITGSEEREGLEDVIGREEPPITYDICGAG